jgi:SAM-dependent methyltransferase
MGDSVYDAACGVGYGSYLLHCAGCKVTGVDNSAEAISVGRASYPGPVFAVGDAADVPAGVDVVVGLEMIEHLEHPGQFLRAVVDAGPRVAVLSTTRPAGGNPFHVREYTHEQFLGLVKPHFASVEMYGQGPDGVIGPVTKDTRYGLAVCMP